MMRRLASKRLRSALWRAADGKCCMCGRALPEGWHARPASGMRYATVAIDTSGEPLELSVTPLRTPPGDFQEYVLANVDRWRQQLGLSPVLTCAANSSGGVMGKMIDAQSIVVAAVATGQHGQEGKILRYVFLHSVALACLVGLVVMLQAYVFPWMIPH